VLLAKRCETLLAKMPEAYRRKAVGDRAQLRGPSVRKQRFERKQLQGKREPHLAAWIPGGVAPIATLDRGRYWHSIQPSDPSVTPQDFHASWKNGDVEAITEHASCSTIADDLRRYWMKRGWITDSPALAGLQEQRRSKERWTPTTSGRRPGQRDAPALVRAALKADLLPSTLLNGVPRPVQGSRIDRRPEIPAGLPRASRTDPR